MKKKINGRVMRLRYVGVADFRKNEATMMTELLDERPMRLGDADVVAFRSGRGDQVVFVHRARRVEDGREVLASERLRLTWGSWNAAMIADYAQMVGIELENLPTLEDFFESLAKLIREHRRAQRAA